MITEYQQLNFSYNWNNKLACTSFTTFRRHNKEKFFVGKKLSVLLKGKHLKDVEVLAVKPMKLHQVNEFIAHLDTGYNVEKFVEIVTNMYKNKVVDVHKEDWVLVLCRDITTDKKAKPLQTTLNL